jgi:hypothetical protein
MDKILFLKKGNFPFFLVKSKETCFGKENLPKLATTLSRQVLIAKVKELLPSGMMMLNKT